DRFDLWTLAGWRLTNDRALGQLIADLGSSGRYPFARRIGLAEWARSMLVQLRGRIVRDAWSPTEERKTEALRIVGRLYQHLSGDLRAMRRQIETKLVSQARPRQPMAPGAGPAAAIGSGIGPVLGRPAPLASPAVPGRDKGPGHPRLPMPRPR